MKALRRCKTLNGNRIEIAAMKNIIFADAGGGVFVLTWLVIAVIACFIAIQIKRRARIELGIFGLILEKIGMRKNPAPAPTPPTQIIPRKCPQCGAELKPDVSEGLCPACLLQRGIATEGGAPPGTPPFTPPTIPDLAKLFPQLEIFELIGKGGMGAVYKARQPALDRFVALKILAPRSGGDLDFAERFTREARALAKLDDATTLESNARRMVEAIERDGWDGDWFLRAYDYFGKVVGSRSNEEGQIFAEPQGMCVMAGVGVMDGRAARAMTSVRDLLGTEHGVMLVQPAFTRYHLELGEISTYPPGYKENGSIFCHVNPWIMIGETMLGHGDAAFEYYQRTNPSARAVISDVHRCEPYVYAQTIAGRDAPSFGEAKNSWLTGSASWHFVAISQWILGIRPELNGLRIDPVLPESWPGFSATRQWRGATYEIVVRQPLGVTGRVGRLVVDGKPVEGNLVPEAPAGSVVRVEAEVEPASSD